MNVARSRGANVILVEDEYIDRDYRTEFASFYARIHTPPEGKCQRLHFLRATDTNESSLNRNGLIQGDRAAEYLGSTVLRPLYIGKVGRTYLRYPGWPEDIIQVTCHARMRSHLCERNKDVQGAPFVRQETMVMVCAQASLWMASHYLHLRYGDEHFYPPDITAKAYEHLSWRGNPLPTAGLTFDHMVNAVSKMGYSPVLRGYKIDENDHAARKNKILEDIFPYLESNMPVVLVFPNHAVCAIGYVSDGTRIAPQRDVQSAADWTRGIVIHDDAAGPYRIMMRSEDLIAAGDAYAPYISKLNMSEVKATLVPLHDRVYLEGEEVDKQVRELLMARKPPSTYLVEELIARGKQHAPDLVKEWQGCRELTGSNRFVIRTYLIDAIEYLEAIGGNHYEGFSAELCERYRASHWPRLIWVSEITTSERMSNAASERTILGEVITDPTANRYLPAQLAFHLPGVLFDYQTRDYVFLTDDRPYKYGMEKDAIESSSRRRI